MSTDQQLKTGLRIAISSDHAAVEMKSVVIAHLKQCHSTIEVTDLGVQCGEMVDYPLQAATVAEKILNKEADKGIMLCGSGIGISIAANRFPHIRAALCHDEYTARMASQHNDANVLVIGGRTTGTETAKAMLDAWLGNSLQEGNHARRIDLIDKVAVTAWEKELGKK